MASPDDVLNVARAELGVSESPANSNRQKYGAAYGMNGVPWCAQFVWWCFAQVGINLKEVSPSWAYTPAGLAAGRARGWEVPREQARPGDIVFYDFHPGVGDPAEHIGIVESNGAQMRQLTAIEGNTSAGDNANGGQVQRRVRGYDSIAGVIRYPLDGRPPMPPMTGDEAKAFRRYVAALLRRDIAALPDLRQGQRGGNVQTLQKALNLAAGRSLAQDGDFGPATAQAVRDVQKIFGLGVDGVVGPRTRAALAVALQKIEADG